MIEREGTQSEHPEIADVNHYDSRVWVRFADGRTVTLTGVQILEAASRGEEEALAEAQESLANAVLGVGLHM